MVQAMSPNVPPFCLALVTVLMQTQCYYDGNTLSERENKSYY